MIQYLGPTLSYDLHALVWFNVILSYIYNSNSIAKHQSMNLLSFTNFLGKNKNALTPDNTNSMCIKVIKRGDHNFCMIIRTWSLIATGTETLEMVCVCVLFPLKISFFCGFTLDLFSLHATTFFVKLFELNKQIFIEKLLSTLSITHS